ncbi:hypothetical protein LUZ60_007630 [Juncus effusus]|nr:hypothetical protein LUZ60_007630 [Juncus effusus]
MESLSPSPPPSPCAALPNSISTFIDAFVDFSVAGIFLPAAPPPPYPPPFSLPTPSRLIAIGDLHGDLEKSVRSLSLAGLVDPQTLRWTGGSTVAVQVGDVLDRGGDELKILYLTRRLQIEADKDGGKLLMLLGNHETLNAARDFRYVAPSGLEEFKNWAKWYQTGMAMKRLCPEIPSQKDPFEGIPKSFPGVKPEFWAGLRARIAALQPTGPITSRFLSTNQTVLMVGDSIFVHGGLLQKHVEYGLEKINEEIRDWLGGNEREPMKWVRGRNAVVWLREFSEGFNCDCEKLQGVLGKIPGAKRLVMGHTIQSNGINTVCGAQAVRVDVGLSKGCGNGVPEVLEINGGGKEIKVLTADWRRVYEERERKDEGLAWLVRESRGRKEVEANA